MLATGISFDRMWIAGYLMVCGNLGFCLYGIVFAEREGELLLYLLLLPIYPVPQILRVLLEFYSKGEKLCDPSQRS